MLPDLLADIAVRVTIPGADPIFTYRAPPRLRTAIRPGRLVWVPLRRKRVQGVVLETYTQEGGSYREIEDLADPEAALTLAQLQLARWIGEYYRAPLYEALVLMLPPGTHQEAESIYRASNTGIAADLGGLPEAERAVLYLLRQRGPTKESDLRRLLRGSDTELRELYRTLTERGLVSRDASVTRAKARPRIEKMVQLAVDSAQVTEATTALERAPKQRAVLAYLAERRAEQAVPPAEASAPEPLFPASALYAETGANLATLRSLAERGLIALSELEVRRDPLSGDATAPDVPPQLTAAQERVWRPIGVALDQGPAVKGQELDEAKLHMVRYDHRPPPPDRQPLSPFLLHGVTGSGKTEIYLRAIARAMRRGKQALVLVPEIALTAQLVRRFAARFPGKLAVLHSGLGMGERYDEWRRLRRGDARLAIGSRSAVFAPLPELGLIILDEEHELTFKHDASPRYHARDAALKLAELTGSVLILGSATPSVESYQAAREGRFQLLRLDERVGMGRDTLGMPRSLPLPLPPVRLVDMRRELQQGNRSIFSRPLQQALDRALEERQQAILFINRRGAASFVMCRDCGHVVSCPNCSSPLTVHYEQAAGGRRQLAGGDEQNVADTGPNPRPLTADPSLLICHGCGHREMPPTFCPQCFSPRVKSFGVGTQRVVEEVEMAFPTARVLRWDRDTVTHKGDHERMLDAMLGHQADVLVGTQMIAKGLDLPLVSVVGVVAADTGLHLPDFRSGERSFQLLTQVAGRAGRRADNAEVVIQSYAPEHYALQAAREHDYSAFFQEEIAYRRQTLYPPFSRLVRFVYSSGSDERAQIAADRLAIELRQLAAECKLLDWGIIGPAPAFFHRQRNRFRWHLLLRAADPTRLLAVLRLPSGWMVDIDPVHVL